MHIFYPYLKPLSRFCFLCNIYFLPLSLDFYMDEVQHGDPSTIPDRPQPDEAAYRPLAENNNRAEPDENRPRPIIAAAPPAWGNILNQPRYAQNQVFRALFFRAARTYVSYFPYGIRRGLETALLIQAFLFFGMLTYIHVHYAHLSLPCLVNKTFVTEEMGTELSYIQANISELPKYSVLRIEMIETIPKENYTLVDSYLKEFRPSDVFEETLEIAQPHIPENDVSGQDGNETATESFFNILAETFKSETLIFQNHHIVEFAEDYGLLRLTPRARRTLNVTVLLALISHDDRCIGSWLDRCILSELLGMDEISIASIRSILPNSTRKGYVRNVMNGETYRFVPATIFSNNSLHPFLSLV